jgi:signal transduction histidine kinase/ligand-binding sensor domain-containing protein
MRFRLLLSLLILIPAWFLSRPVRADSNGGVNFYPGTVIRFDQIRMEQGLSQNAILALLQDSRGYLWVGTQDGLNRYDGYGMTQFKANPNDPNSLSFNSVISLYEDPDGFLWIGTWGGGLNRYNPATNQFTRFLPDPNDPASLSNAVVTSIIQDEHGRMWVGTLDGLDLYYPATGKFIHFHSDIANPTTLSSNAISVITPTEDGKLWIGTGAFGTFGNGLNLFDPSSGETTRFTTYGNCLKSPNISSIAVGKNGNLWIGHGGSGLPGGGVDEFDPISSGCWHFEGSYGTQYTNNNVTRLLFDQDDRLWVTIWGGGLLYMDPDKPGMFANIRHDAADTESLSSDNTSTLLLDRSGVLWVGTFDSGLNKLNLESLQFRTYKNNPANTASLASNRVSAFAETRDGGIWVGTMEAGLDKFDPLSGEFTHFRNIPSNLDSLSSNRILSLYADPDGTLWIGTVNNGLNHYDPLTGIFKHYRHDSADPSSLIDDEVTYINRDGAGILWVATMGGLSRLDPGSDRFVNYSGLSGAPVTLKTDGGDLWIGTWGGGASRLSLALPGILPANNARLTVMLTLMHDTGDPNSLSENSVWAIHKSTTGMFWFGTAGGLNRYDPKTGDFKLYTEKQGLPSTSIVGITEDLNGFLWMTTANGLARFDLETETFRNFDKSDGLQGNEFTANACFTSPTTGDIYIGGSNGFTVFNPEQLKVNTTLPKAVFTGFNVFDQPYPFDPQGINPIRLNYNQDFVSINFAALDFHTPSKNTFAYMLEGYDSAWIQAGTRHSASYANLPPGSYTFRLKAANSDGVWEENAADLSITISPPFWQRWQYQALFVMGLIAVVFAGFRWRLREIRRNERKLEIRIAERTEELKQANRLLSEKAAQDAVTAERTRLARELHDAVTQTLFSATLIADVLPDLWNKNLAEGNRRLEELRQLTRGALAEMRTLLVELRPNALVEVPLPTLLKQFTESLTGRARINIQLSNCGDRKLPADVQIGLYRIAQEALNNVVKHANATQALVTLQLDDTVWMSIIDDGIGFTPDTVTADHLGLKIMRERAEAIGAELFIQTSAGQGTRINVTWKAGSR